MTNNNNNNNGLRDSGGFFYGKSTVSDVIIAPCVYCLEALFAFINIITYIGTICIYVYCIMYIHIYDTFVSLVCIGSNKIKKQNRFHYRTRVRVARQFCSTSSVVLPLMLYTAIFFVFIFMY